ncbi:peptidoglycan-binding protein [Bacillus sp. H-16]|uniref:peptidoglycan-binding protein n=1 Tax=Alteribacter salitolerans TaxID=2912333 RepID=UPI0019639F22|nr:peptidoglycan-binding protein [Alteribacter salitolerans]MBM7096827.1 peptidoglycan-binding protein [Alteribacter salitolerans]
MNELSEEELKKGDEGEAVLKLQQDLQTLGFMDDKDIDGYFGSVTKDNVEMFQYYYQLHVSGVADIETLNYIQELLTSPFRMGNSHAEVVNIKYGLNELGFYVSTDFPTSYGPATDEAVRTFQEYYGLVVNGIYDSVTSSAMEKNLNNSLRSGENNLQVEELKNNLNYLGFPVAMSFPMNFGPATEIAVEDFQAYYGLVVNGMGDEVTLRKINEIIEAPLAPGLKRQDVIQFKRDLKKSGFKVSSNPTDWYGPSTEKVVNEFQEYFKISSTDSLDDTTLSLLASIVNSPLQSGMNNDETKQLKIDLNNIGFEVSMNYPGSFGPSTESALMSFQRYYGLVSNGIGDPRTISALNDILDSPFRLNQNSNEVRSLKENLNFLGFPVSMNFPNNFGLGTEAAVKSIQRYYGLVPNGIGDPNTLSKMNEVLSAPLEPGLKRQDVVDLKIDLGNLGFAVSSNPTDWYGPTTEKVVRDFQEYYGLPITGKSNKDTLDMINSILSSSLREGQNNLETASLKSDLNKLGFPVTMNFPNSYGPSTAKAVSDLQRYYGLRVNGIGDVITLEKINKVFSSPLRLNQSHDEVVQLKENLNKIGFPVSMNFPRSYGPATEQAVRDFQSSLGLPVSGIADENTLAMLEERANLVTRNGLVTASNLNVRTGPGNSHNIIGSLPQNTNVIIKNDNGNGWYEIVFNRGSAFVSAGHIKLATNELDGKIIMLDPGHGDGDVGGIGNGLLEKDVVLDISLRARRLLENSGATVIMTRETDVFYTLGERASMANSSNADIFISVHANAFNGVAHGTETFWHGKYKRAESQKLAHSIQDAVVKHMGTHYRRVDEGNYHVIRETVIPSALLEVGFLDHAGDAAKLRQSSYLQKSAEGILEGVIQYYK